MYLKYDMIVKKINKNFFGFSDFSLIPFIYILERQEIYAVPSIRIENNIQAEQKSVFRYIFRAAQAQAGVKMRKDVRDILVQYITENQAQFYRLAYSYVHDRESALDIVQNSIVKALEKYETIRNTDAVRTWFYRVIVNESLSYINRYKREIPSEPEDFNSLPAEEVPDGDYELYYLIDRLPTELKTVIMLRFYESMSLKEIAQVTGCGLSKVKYRLYTGLNKLKNAIEEDVI